MTMGRRARTHCSPVDSALEKYHSDIGNRLSGVFIPPRPCPANAEQQSTCDAFSMLTLDFRGEHGIRHTTSTLPATTTTTTTTTLPTSCQKSATMPHLNNSKDDNNNKSLLHESEDTDSHKDDSAFGHIPSAGHAKLQNSSTLPSLNAHQNDLRSVSTLKEKRNIMDKLARAIFQRKHACARCQRRSRSCLQNKTFNVSDKHYTCARCRHTSKAFKNLMSGQHTSDSDVSKSSADIILRKPRLELKDSGYDTVTSCSTVASAHSNSNSPYASSNKHVTDESHCTVPASGVSPACLRGETVTPSEVDQEVDELIRKANSWGLSSATPLASGQARDTTRGHTKPHGHASYVNTNNLTNAGLEQYLGLAGGDGRRALKQVKTRYVQDYDGYLNLPGPAGHGHQDGYCQCDESDSSCSDTASDGQVTGSGTAPKMCHMCETRTRPCFRLPWEGGWLCEDCIDGML